MIEFTHLAMTASGQEQTFAILVLIPLFIPKRTVICHHWVTEIGVDPTQYGTHSMRRTKVTLIYRRTKNIRAIQLLLGHTKIESTVRYLGIDVDEALEMSEQTEI
jgi:integrase